MSHVRILSHLEARVLGTLMEKALTVPDSYPLTLNAVVSGCNQKTSREPLMQLDEAQAQQALDSLRSASLVFESSGGRASRYEHNFARAYGVPGQSVALLGLLMLRGPQTAGELRINAERWHRFADISAVEGFLDELQERAEDKGGPLVRKLARAPGARESRWAHLLCGPVDEQEATPPAAARTVSVVDTSPEILSLQTRLAAAESELAQLRQTVQRLCAELGIPSSSAEPI